MKDIINNWGKQFEQSFRNLLDILHNLSLFELNLAWIELNYFNSVGQIDEDTDLVMGYEPFGYFSTIHCVNMSQTSFKNQNIGAYLNYS